MKQIKPPKVIRKLDGIYHPKLRTFVGEDSTITLDWRKPDDEFKLTQQNWWGNEKTDSKQTEEGS